MGQLQCVFEILFWEYICMLHDRMRACVHGVWL